MMSCYPLLVESIIELKRYLRRFLCEFKGLPYMETVTAYHTSLARGFKLVLREGHDKYYCLTEGQQLDTRIEDLKHHMYKPDIVQKMNREKSMK